MCAVVARVWQRAMATLHFQDSFDGYAHTPKRESIIQVHGNLTNMCIQTRHWAIRRRLTAGSIIIAFGLDPRLL